MLGLGERTKIRGSHAAPTEVPTRLNNFPTTKNDSASAHLRTCRLHHSQSTVVALAAPLSHLTFGLILLSLWLTQERFWRMVCLVQVRNSSNGFLLHVCLVLLGMAMSDKPLRSDFRSIYVFFHAVFMRVLNDPSDWTDQFDSGCKVDDEDLSAAYRMIRLAGFDLLLKYCGVKDLPDGPLQNYHICCPTSGKNGSWKQPPCFTPACQFIEELF